MSSFLLDTSVLIDISKGREAVVNQVREMIGQGARLGICGVNVAEFYTGIDPERSLEMDRFIASLSYWPLSLTAAMQAGAYRREYRRRGLQLSTSDTLIAAIAWDQDAALVTGNVKHFPMDDLDVVVAGG